MLHAVGKEEKLPQQPPGLAQGNSARTQFCSNRALQEVREHQRLLQNLSHGAYLTPGVPLANFFFLSPLSLVFRGFNDPSNSTFATISPVLPTVLHRAGDDRRTRSSP